MRNLWTGAAALALAACGNEQSSAKTAEATLAPAATRAAASTAKSESKTFRDWYAVCDNGNLCSAYTGGSTGWILVQMDAGPAAQPTVRVGMWPDNGEELKAAITLIIDGRGHATTPGPEDTSSAILPAADARAVIAELTAGRAVSLSSGDQTIDLPVAGASASLLWFDERQGRLDTTTALQRKGMKPATAVPAAPALPTIVAARAVSQGGFAVSRETVDGEAISHPVIPATLEAIPAVKQCREETDFNEYLRKAVTANRLDATTELWGIPCSGGAYNESYAYYLTGPRGAQPRLADFPDAQGERKASDEEDDRWLTNPNYDADTRTMSAFAKGRGIADCGVSQSWTWTGQAFILNSESVMSECFGITSELWPTTFRSR